MSQPPTEPGPVPDDSLRSPRWARVMGLSGRILVGAGVLIALFAAYQVWGTNLQEARAQSELRDDLESRLARARSLLADVGQATPPSVTDPLGTDSTEPENPPETGGSAAEGVEADDSGPAEIDPEVLALLFPEGGEAAARIEIPALDVDKVVVRGVHVADLRKGPGLYPSTVLPGHPGNAAIAGHRTTYGAPFGSIDELAPGDDIVVTTVQGRFVYRVLAAELAFASRLGELADVGEGHAIVSPSDTWVLGDFHDNRLTLTACHPRYSARQRIIVAAELVSEPVRLPDAIERMIARTLDGTAAESDAVDPSDEPVVAGEPDATDDEPVVAGEPDATDDEPVAAGEPDATEAPGPNLDLADLTAGADLDEGLTGERGAIPAAAGWLVAAVGLWLVGARYSRRQVGWRRLVPYAVMTVPVAVTLWLCFEAADRALPAY